MGPRGFGGPPPSEFNERLKEPLPKNIKEIPNYLKRVIGSFLKRLFYIISLVFEAKKSLLILMVIMALFNGVSPVISAYISANLLNKIADAIALVVPLIFVRFTITLAEFFRKK